jgi:hypothetical protein
MGGDIDQRDKFQGQLSKTSEFPRLAYKQAGFTPGKVLGNSRDNKHGFKFGLKDHNALKFDKFTDVTIIFLIVKEDLKADNEELKKE